jgi:hypothetical protein
MQKIGVQGIAINSICVDARVQGSEALLCFWYHSQYASTPVMK